MKLHEIKLTELNNEASYSVRIEKGKDTILTEKHTTSVRSGNMNLTEYYV